MINQINRVLFEFDYEIEFELFSQMRRELNSTIYFSYLTFDLIAIQRK